MKLQEFDMQVKYRKGEENGAADYVSSTAIMFGLAELSVSNN